MTSTTAKFNLDKNQLRQLRIKTGIVQRLTKDITSYKSEAHIQQHRLEKMKAEGKDEYDIMKMGLVVQESLMMVPHCIRKLLVANQELETYLDSFGLIEEEVSHCDNDDDSLKQIAKAKNQLEVARNTIKEEEISEENEEKK